MYARVWVWVACSKVARQRLYAFRREFPQATSSSMSSRLFRENRNTANIIPRPHSRFANDQVDHPNVTIYMYMYIITRVYIPRHPTKGPPGMNVA